MNNVDLDTASQLVDYKSTYSALRERGLLGDLRRLKRPQVLQSSLALFCDWILIFVGWFLVCYVSYWFIPLSIILIGSRQRALGNLLHEAGHRMLYRSRAVNEFVGTVSISLPFLTLLPYYRKDHFSHHAYLGSANNDPELIHREEDRSRSALQLFLVHLLDFKMFKINVFAAFPVMRWSDRFLVMAWWVAFLGLFAFLFGLRGMAIFAGLWIVSKATTFHAITVFREISDHVGLTPGTVIGFTRNSPRGTFWNLIIHPHMNNYHLTHHLAPRIPFSRIAEAHKVLLNIPAYAAAHHCDRYFSGERSLISCLIGRCVKWHCPQH